MPRTRNRRKDDKSSTHALAKEHVGRQGFWVSICFSTLSFAMLVTVVAGMSSVAPSPRVVASVRRIRRVRWQQSATLSQYLHTRTHPFIVSDLFDNAFAGLDYDYIRKLCGDEPLLQKKCTGGWEGSLMVAGSDEDWAGLASANMSHIMNGLGITTMGDVLDANEKGEQIYLFDKEIAAYCPKLLQHVRIPNFFPDSVDRWGSDWFDRENAPNQQWTSNKCHMLDGHEVRRYGQPSVFFGSPAMNSSGHIDNAFTKFFMVMIAGKKRYRILSPESYSLVERELGLDLFHIMNNLDLFNMELPPGAVVYEGDVGPGELIYVPPGWNHAAQNLGLTVAYSLNFNDETDIDLSKLYSRLLGSTGQQKHQRRWQCLSSKNFSVPRRIALPQQHLTWEQWANRIEEQRTQCARPQGVATGDASQKFDAIAKLQATLYRVHLRGDGDTDMPSS